MQHKYLNDEFWVRAHTIVVAVTPYKRLLYMTVEGATLGLFMREASVELETCKLLTLDDLVHLLYIVDTR